ncbi:MAG: hypothetical protein HY791_15830 [Deltaproteobacteria bacterium]|nr:hypothetical protein [Deltaproteobacteria bacterium]
MDRELALRANASHQYAVEGIKLLELAQRAYSLYESQPPREQRALLEIVLSNCVLEGISVRIYLRKPFDLMLDCTEIEIGGVDGTRNCRKQCKKRCRCAHLA